MHINNLHILYTVLVLMIAQAHCSQFMCYVCDDCADVNANTPKQACDETFFNKDTTLPPTVTTDSTTEKVVVTTVETTETTLPESTESTNPPPPTPPTIAPVETTTPLPTPPNPGTVVVPTEIELAKLNETTTISAVTTTQTTLSDNAETTLPTTILQPVKLLVGPAEIRMRQLRSVYNAEFSYHCYSVKEKINGTLTTSRGCSRIGPTEAVCTQLQQANNGTEYSSCTPCSNTLCNSSSAVGASMAAMIVGLLMLFKFTA